MLAATPPKVQRRNNPTTNDSQITVDFTPDQRISVDSQENQENKSWLSYFKSQFISLRDTDWLDMIDQNVFIPLYLFIAYLVECFLKGNFLEFAEAPGIAFFSILGVFKNLSRFQEESEKEAYLGKDLPASKKRKNTYLFKAISGLFIFLIAIVGVVCALAGAAIVGGLIPYIALGVSLYKSAESLVLGVRELWTAESKEEYRKGFKYLGKSVWWGIAAAFSAAVSLSYMIPGVAPAAALAAGAIPWVSSLVSQLIVGLGIGLALCAVGYRIDKYFLSSDDSKSKQEDTQSPGAEYSAMDVDTETPFVTDNIHSVVQARTPVETPQKKSTLESWERFKKERLPNGDKWAITRLYLRCKQSLFGISDNILAPETPATPWLRSRHDFNVLLSTDVTDADVDHNADRFAINNADINSRSSSFDGTPGKRSQKNVSFDGTPNKVNPKSAIKGTHLHSPMPQLSEGQSENSLSSGQQSAALQAAVATRPDSPNAASGTCSQSNSETVTPVRGGSFFSPLTSRVSFFGSMNKKNKNAAAQAANEVIGKPKRLSFA